MPRGLRVKTALAALFLELVADVEVELARRAVPSVVNNRDTVIHADRADRQVEAQADAVISTALIPGRAAPVLITEDMVKSMKPGSVIIDLAAATGGNTPYTKNDQTIEQGPVRIVGNSNLAATMPADASKLYGKNIQNFLSLLIGADGSLQLNWTDELVSGSCITNENKVVHPRLIA